MWLMDKYDKLPTVGGVLEGLTPSESIAIIRGKDILHVGTASQFIEDHRRDAILWQKVSKTEKSQFSTLLHI